MMKKMMEKMMPIMMESMMPEERQDTMLKLMPEMMKEIKGSDVMDIIQKKGFEMMLKTYKSRFDFSETVQKIKASGEDAGWYNPIITNHYEIERSLGINDPNKVATISMCIPRAAHKILKINKQLCVMMPLQITVYEEDDEVYVAWMNIALMGKMFGRTVAEVMEKASDDLLNTLNKVFEPKEKKNERHG